MRDRIALGCGGGKAPGWPAGIKAATEVAEANGFEVVAVENGTEGLVLPGAQYRNIREYGNQRDFFLSARSPIYSSRHTPFNKKKLEGETDKERDARALREFQESQVKQIIMDNLRENRVKLVIFFGGDDTLWTMDKLTQADVLEGNASPKTIDNDVPETLTFGHLTAGSVGRMVVDGIREEARTYNRVGIVESMGRQASFLPAQHYNADIILPAKEFEIEMACIIERVRQVFQENGRKERSDPNKGHAVVTIAEGFLFNGEETFVSTIECPHEHKKLGGVGHRLQDWLEDAGMKTTYERPGYLYRFMPPTQEDAELSYALAREATVQAMRGNTGVSAVAQGRARSISNLPISKVQGRKHMRYEDYDFERLRPKGNEVRAE